MTPLEKQYVGYLVTSALVVLAVCIPGSPLSIRAATSLALQAGAAGSQKQSPAVDRTTPIIQKMTPAQRHHSQLFEEFSTGERLLDELTNLNRFRDRVASESRPMSEIARELRCAADDVFIGTVEGSQSLPIADGTFLFTEYTVRITEDVANPTGPLRPGRLITVLRPGGSTQVGEHTVTAYLSDVPKLIVGASYLFFEKRVAATGGYRSARHDGTFSVTDETVKSLGRLPALEGDLAKGARKDLFLNAVRAAGPCR